MKNLKKNVVISLLFMAILSLSLFAFGCKVKTATIHFETNGASGYDNVKVDNVCIIGLDDIQTGDPDIKKAFQKSQSPRILLTHSPDVFPLVTEEITLALAGHTHGGQIVFPFNIPIIVPSKYGKKYAKGLICENNKKIFITKGLGTSILPLRFCCIPEIVLIDFCDN